MRTVFINYAHPQKPHVSAVRMQRFAEALSNKGHQIILLTRSLTDTDVPEHPSKITKNVMTHDWSKPFQLTCPPSVDLFLNSVRENTLSPIFRKALVAWYLAFKSGVHHDWVKGTKHYWQIITDRFRPHVIWATFGDTDSLWLAQQLSRRIGCPWVMDLKDNWEENIPWPLRGLLQRRFRDAQALTVNSKYLRDQALKTFRKVPTLIYSGAPVKLLSGQAPARRDQLFRITLIGSTYGPERFQPFLEQFKQWANKLSSSARENLLFVYAGADSKQVKSNIQVLDSICKYEVYDYLPFDQMAALCMAASINCYLWLPTGFHHKLIELLMFRRPIVVFPGEYKEAQELASLVGGELHICTNPEELQQTFTTIRYRTDDHHPIGNIQSLRAFSWEAQAALLSDLLLDTIEYSSERIGSAK